jgi:phosphoserine phosphatase
VEIIDGRFTGQPLGVPSFREGKIIRVNEWLRSLGKTIVGFPQSYFYSDSMNDLPLLEMVSNPIAVNPDAVLRDHAGSRGWPVIQLHELP